MMKAGAWLICTAGIASMALWMMRAPLPSPPAPKPGAAQEGRSVPAGDAQSADPDGELLEARIHAEYGRAPLSFAPNRGQSAPQVKFLSHGAGYTLFLTPNEAVFVPGERLGAAARDARHRPQPLRMELLGANPAADTAGMNELPGEANYFVGNDPSQWRTHVPTYARVKLSLVYPGIDLIYYGNQRDLEYDFVLRPGAEPRNIQLKFDGLRRLAMDADGGIVCDSGAGAFHLRRPRVYQQRDGGNVEVPGRYAVREGNRVEFILGKYDPGRELVIDPTLSYSTYLGGSGTDQASGIAVDAAGDAYIVGATTSSNFPTKNPFQSMLGLASEGVFISKFKPDGSNLIYSTYLSGNNNDQGLGIAVDSTGNAYITGLTTSSNFPTVGPFQANLGSGAQQNAFVSKLNPTGSALVYSTYLGGSVNDVGTGIALDSSGDAYIVGTTSSKNFPLASPIQSVLQGTQNAFVTKLNAQGSALSFSTYLGGGNSDQGAAIAVDSSGNAYVTGTTSSTNFPTVAPFQPALAGGTDAFVSELNSSGSALVYSTFLGGSNTDQGFGIAVDSSGNAYVAGGTSSTNFPILGGVQASLASGSDAFITEINSSGSALVYSTYLGGTSGDQAFAIAVDSTGNAYVTGQTRSVDFPNVNAFQGALAGIANAFVAKLNSGGASLAYSSYLGGSGLDSGNAITVDSGASAYLTGGTGSNNFLLASPFQPAFGGSEDAFITKISATPAPGVRLSPTSVSFGSVTLNTTSPPQIVTITNTGDASLTISSVALTGTNITEFAETNTCGGSLATGANCTASITFTPTLGGTQAAALTVTDDAPGSPQNVILSGIGLGLTPTVSLFPNSLTFSALSPGGISAPQTVTVQNTGTGPLTITSVIVAGANKKDFAETNNCGGSLAVMGICTLSVTFTPTTTGTRAAVIEINDSALPSPQLVLLIGGEDFSLFATPSVQVITAGQTTSYTISVTPAQGFNQSVTFSCTNLPIGTACAFSPASVTLDGTNIATTTLTFSTTVRAAPAPRPGPSIFPGAPGLLVALLASCAMMAMVAAFGWAGSRRRAWVGWSVAMLFMALAIGCGGKSAPSTTSKPGPTPAGTYTVTVMGTAGTLMEHSTFTVVVN